MYTVIDEFGLVWCQSKSFPAAQHVAEYMLLHGHTPRLEHDLVEPLFWRCEKEKLSAPGKER